MGYRSYNSFNKGFEKIFRKVFLLNISLPEISSYHSLASLFRNQAIYNTHKRKGAQGTSKQLAKLHEEGRGFLKL